MNITIRKYLIDAILAVIFVVAWVYLTKIDYPDQSTAMISGAISMLVYTTALRVNNNHYKRMKNEKI